MMGAAFLNLFNTSISAVWLILAVIALRFLLKGSPKRIMCLLWGIVALRLILPFELQSSLSLVPSAKTIPVQSIYAEESTTAPASPNRIEVKSGIDPIDRVVNPVVQTTPVSTMRSGAEVFARVWIVGVFLLLLYAVISYLSMRHRVYEAVPLEGNIYLCDAVKTPFILGIVKPKIYLPSHTTEQQMPLVIAHERAHLRHKDHWWKPLGFLLLAVYWFNPLVALAYALFCKDMELACDEAAIRHMPMEEKKAYSHALVSLSMQRRTVFICPLAFGEVGVKERIKAVLQYKKPKLWIVLVALAACAVIAVCFLTNPPDNKPVLSQSPEGGQETPAATPSPEGGQEVSPYDALIQQARDTLLNPPDVIPEQTMLSSVFYMKNDYETLGYLIKDLDGDGVDELIFGANTTDGAWNGVIYNIYTLMKSYWDTAPGVEGEENDVVQIINGWERNRYYLCKNGAIANESSSSAFESSFTYYTYSAGRLALIESVMFNSNVDEANPWFYSTVAADIATAVPISEADAEEIMAKYVYEELQFTPFIG